MNLLILGLLFGGYAGFFFGYYSGRIAVGWEGLSAAQRAGVEERSFSWAGAVAITLACIGGALVPGVYVMSSSHFLEGVAFFIWLAATAPFLVLHILHRKRLVQEELSRTRT